MELNKINTIIKEIIVKHYDKIEDSIENTILFKNGFFVYIEESVEKDEKRLGEFEIWTYIKLTDVEYNSNLKAHRVIQKHKVISNHRFIVDNEHQINRDFYDCADIMEICEFLMYVPEKDVQIIKLIDIHNRSEERGTNIVYYQYSKGVPKPVQKRRNCQR